MISKLSPFIVTALMFVGCAKKEDFKENDSRKLSTLMGKELPVEYVKNLCTLDDPCLWAPSVADTPKEVPASRPFWQGDEKLVITRLVEGKLQILQIEENERSQENINNFSPVAEIKVKHVDYECKEDANGDCSNEEVEAKDIPWSSKKYVRIEELKVVEKNSLPIQFGELFRAGCYESTDTDSNLVDGGFQADGVNFRTKTTYKGNPSCVRITEMGDLRYLNFTVDYHYSLTKLSALTDKNYKPIDYPSYDESKFGFFKTEIKNKTVDHHDHVMGLRSNLLNRWSPNKKEIVYYLNEDFYKPEMSIVLESTNAAINSVNKSLSKAKSGIKIVLKDGRDKTIGNIKNSFLVLVSDPQASGVIGYGPSVKNPKTGEILSARTVMYYGTIEKFVSSTYDDLVDEYLAKVEAKMQVDALLAEENLQNTTSSTGASTSYISSNLSHMASPLNSSRIRGNLNALKDQRYTYHSTLNNLVIDENDQSAAFHQDYIAENLKEFKRKTDIMSKQCFMSGHDLDLKNELQQMVEGFIKSRIDKSQASHWDDLSEDIQKELITLLMPKVWTSTLIHEFGHNLGLRHNFYGSTDKDNYYTDAEARNLGMLRTPTYSSIMDYAGEGLTELEAFGKYDIAALKFAYARKVETSLGKELNLVGTIKNYKWDTIVANIKAKYFVDLGEISSMNEVIGALNSLLEEGELKLPVAQEIYATASKLSTTVQTPSLKPYKYCSDEHVNTNQMCNRFDEGTTNEEVVKYYIEKYNKMYTKVNYRGRRYDYNSRNGDLNYLFRTMGTLGNIRSFFDVFDQAHFRGDYKQENVSEYLKDIKRAADLSFDTFMNILETPAYHCYQENSDGSTKFAPFNEFVLGSPLAQYGITFDIKNGCEIIQSQINSPIEQTAAQERAMVENLIEKLVVDLERKKFELQEAFVQHQELQTEESKDALDQALNAQILAEAQLNGAKKQLKAIAERVKKETVKIYSVGKYFNNSLDLTKDFSAILQGDNSQIDVRGYWMDKIFASTMISARASSPSTIGAASNGSFLDYPEYNERFSKYMNGLLTNKFTKKVNLKFLDKKIYELDEAKNGVEKVRELTYTFDSTSMINKSYHGGINWFFGLSKTQNSIKSILLSNLKKQFRRTNLNDESLERDESAYNTYNVDRLKISVPESRYRYDDFIRFTNSNGELSYRFGFYNNNTKAVNLNKLKLQIEELIKKDSEKVKKAADLVRSGADISAESDEVVASLANKYSDVIVDYVDGILSLDSILSSLIALSK